MRDIADILKFGSCIFMGMGISDGNGWQIVAAVAVFVVGCFVGAFAELRKKRNDLL